MSSIVISPGAATAQVNLQTFIILIIYMFKSKNFLSINIYIFIMSLDKQYFRHIVGYVKMQFAVSLDKAAILPVLPVVQ